jgi:hypothetical protein
MKKILTVGALFALAFGLFTFTTGIASAAPKPSGIQYVRMPSLIGIVDGQLRWKLSTNGYKFSVAMTKSNPGYNTKLSCLMSGRNYITRQNPSAGLTVANTSATTVTVWVNCG